jgi:hypothetical protein
MKKGYLFFYLCSLLLASCGYRDDYAYVPDINDLVYSTDARAINNPGKIYLFRQYLFVGEPGIGVHVFDNSDPSTPIPVCFINIPYNYDVAVKDSILYADTYYGLVAIRINELPKIEIVKFITKDDKFPPLPNNVNGFRWDGNASKTYFECIDSKKGIVVGWQSVKLKKPICYQ